MSIFIPLAKDQPAPVPTVKHDDDVTRFARLAIVIGVMLSIAFTMLVFACVLWGWVGEWRFGVGLWLSLLALAWMLAAGFGAWWTYRLNVKRPVDVDDEERQYRYAAQYISNEPQIITEPAPIVTVVIDDKTGSKTQTKRFDLPCPLEDLQVLSKGLVAGIAFTEAEWTGSGKPFSRGDNGSFTKLRNELVVRGLMAWRDPEVTAKGMSPTKAGWAVFRHLAGSPTETK